MSRNRSAIVSLAALVAMLLGLTGIAGAGAPARPLAQGGAPAVVSYQGQVRIAGQPYSGTGQFKFAVVDGSGATAWSNDGSASGEPAAAVELDVTNGLFTVLLGDTSLTNMTAPPATAFDGTERYLRVWFASDGSTFEQLPPDTRIAAVPYALQAEEARNADLLDGFHAEDLRTHYQNVIVVAKSGGDFTTISAALSSIRDAAAGNRYLVWVAPGTYSERVTMKRYVDIEGAGELATRITSGGSSSEYTGTVVGASDAELRSLMVENTGGGGSHATAVYNAADSFRLTSVTATARGSSMNQGVYNRQCSSPVMTDVTATGSGGSYSYGIFNFRSSATIRQSTIRATGGGTNYGIENDSQGTGSFVMHLDHSLIEGANCAIHSAYRVYVGASQLVGPVCYGTFTCTGAYNGAYVSLNASCH